MKHLEINKFAGLKEAIEENIVDNEILVTLDGVDKYVMLDVDIYDMLLADLNAQDTMEYDIPTDVDVRVEGLDLNNLDIKLSSEEFEDLKEKVVEALERKFKPNTKYN